MSQVITNAFEQYWQSSLAAEQPVVLDEFVLADIPNLDITSPIDPDTGLPPAGQIVYRQDVDQRGRINNNAVAYSIVMDTSVGDFSFNAMYLRNKANGVIGMIVYKGRETKLKTDQTTGQTGNSLVKSMLMGYDQAAEATLTHVDAGTWQIDYAARLRGQDEDLRQLASQLYGHHTFIGDGFKVVQHDGGHQVTPGVAIVGGLRVELSQPEVIYPGSKPIGVWVDVYRAGSLLSEHQNIFTIITSVADLTDHLDSSGYQHYVAKLGTVQVDGTILDVRGLSGISAELMGFQQAGTGSVPRTSQDKMREKITPQDFLAAGDGVTNDTAAFTKLEANYIGLEIDLLGKTYYVDSPFYGNKYYNGLWVGPFGTGTSRTRWQGAQMTGAGRIVFGDGALASLPENYSMGESATVVAVGYGAMGKMTQVKKAIAIGTNSQAEGTISRDNISIGEDALRFVQSRTPDYDQSQQQGTRNIAMGGNAGRFIYEGIRDIAIGRNAGQCLVNSVNSTIVGSNAVAGCAPIGLSGVIENWAPNNGPDGVTAFGALALERTITGFNAAVGERAAESLVAGRGNVVMGPLALSNAEIDSGFNGKQLTNLNINGTYSHSGNTLTLTFAGHGVSVGFTVGIRLLDGGSQTFQGDIAPAVVVSVIDANTFTVYHPTSRTASGTATLYWRINLTDAPKAEFNCVYGALAANSLRVGSENSVYGYRAMFEANSAASPSRNTVYGFMALTGWTDPQRMTAVGYYALRIKQDGSVATGTGNNCSGLGQNTRISGDDQVQLGDAATTTYVYGTVQNRSDERDKADIVETSLGIEFIMGLRAVDGRWDMRDDYFEEYEQQVGIDENAQPVFETRLRKIPKDGSKKRTRKHHWFIAQEVKELCDNLGVEFGGYQDHSVNGGCDVLSLGYDEFIPPMTKAIQQCWQRMDEIELRLKTLEGGA